MFDGVFQILLNLIWGLTSKTMWLINTVFNDVGTGDALFQYDVNLSLFSDIPILSMDLDGLLSLFFIIFYTMFFIILLYKVTKKIIKKVFGVIRL